MSTLQANYGSIATVESNTNHLVSKKAEAGTKCCSCSVKFNKNESCMGHTASNVDHVFHEKCLKEQWNQGNRSCPVCPAHLTDPENRLVTDPENRLGGRLTAAQKCYRIGIAISALGALGTVVAIGTTLGFAIMNRQNLNF